MAIPSGSGSEVLKHHRVLAVSNSWVALIPVADINVNIIVTVISIIVTNTHTANVQWNLATHDYNGSAYSNESRFLHTQSIATTATFVWSDRFVLYSGSASTRPSLRGLSEAASNVDVHTSYIVQNWT